MSKILIIGANGQLGSELTQSLRAIHGMENVIASDKMLPQKNELPDYFVQLDVMDSAQVFEVVKKHKISEVYHLAAILSARGEQNPLMAWDLNMQSLITVLELARENHIQKVYWPSSIAVFGPDTPRNNTPQTTIMNPSTVYGISKLAGERWCEYYYNKYQVDVRSLRYPGIIGYKTLPGGGTTDYAVDIFFKAVKNEPFVCFLKENTSLPMMYINDAIRATIDLMSSPAELIKVRSSYNIAAMSFTPTELAEAIKTRIPDFSISYEPDFRQAIADSWPNSIDDTKAREDWHWKEQFDMMAMSNDILDNIKVAHNL
jgi:nucleoside-diphosphate-sugar epimerase